MSRYKLNHQPGRNKKFFKILAPFNQARSVPLLKKAGADELYCGYVTQELTKKWPLAFGILNRRGEGQSFEDYDEFRKAAVLAHRHGLPVYVTMNGLYTPKQYPLLLELAEKVECLDGVRGIIVADVGFLLELKRKKFRKEIHISTGGTCFNSYTADFFHDLGAKRIVLDRQLTSYEINKLINEITSDIGIEIFIICEGCGGFIDGYCTFYHCLENEKMHKMKKGLIVSSSYNMDQESKGCNFYFFKNLAKSRFKTISCVSYKEKNMGLRFQGEKHELLGCRMCDLYDLNKYPLKSLKIVGRGNEPEYSVKLVRSIAQSVSWLTSGCFSKKEYCQKCKDLFFLVNQRPCTKYDCYFSPHWVKDEN